MGELVNEMLKRGEIEESVSQWVMKNDDVKFYMDYQRLILLQGKMFFHSKER